MISKIVTIGEIKLIGMHINQSLSDSHTIELWKQFMPRKKEIMNLKNSWYYSIQIYDAGFKMENFKPNTMFEMWACVEVNDLEHVPEAMESYILNGGKYAVFIHKGDGSKFKATMDFIMRKWLPNSGFELDNRAYFEVMKDKYLGENDPNSEEEVWIPIK